MNEKRNVRGINIGSSLILITFVLLCLIAFSVLSLASANSDFRLTEQVAERKSAYYEACNKAEERLQELAHSDLSENDGSTQISFEIPITENEYLAVSATASENPDGPQKNDIKITEYRVITLEE